MRTTAPKGNRERIRRKEDEICFSNPSPPKGFCSKGFGKKIHIHVNSYRQRVILANYT